VQPTGSGVEIRGIDLASRKLRLATKRHSRNAMRREQQAKVAPAKRLPC
jgi:hypothetical protein